MWLGLLFPLSICFGECIGLSASGSFTVFVVVGLVLHQWNGSFGGFPL